MSQELPVSYFEWKDDIEHFIVIKVPKNSNKGYILEVDLGNSCYHMQEYYRA